MTEVFGTIAHLPGSHLGDDDVLLPDAHVAPFFDERVWVFEKLDGINMMVSLDRGRPVAHFKPKWRAALDGAVLRASGIWLRQREAALSVALKGGVTLYGEWLWHRVSVAYDALPDVWVAFGGHDRRGRPLDWEAVLGRCESVGLAVNAPVFDGVLTSPRKLRSLVGRSICGEVAMEGLVVQRSSGAEPLYAKWVEHHYRPVGPAQMSGELNGVR